MTPLRPALLVLLALLAPLAQAAPAPEAPERALLPDAASALVGLARGDVTVETAMLAAWARQDGRADAMLAAAAAAGAGAAPPEIIFRDAQAACDLDGDGVRDLVVNNLTLRSPPRIAGAQSEIEAVSGATGLRLWKIPNQAYGVVRSPPSIALTAKGQPLPDTGSSVRAFVDLDGDGACDVLAYGLHGEVGFAAPVFNEPSVTPTTITVRAVSGRTGEELWALPFEATVATAQEPVLGTGGAIVTRGWMTGAVPAMTAAGPRVVVKLTDITYSSGALPVSVGLPAGFPDVLKGSLYAEDVRVTEHVQMRDAATGELIWERTIGQDTSAEAVQADARSAAQAESRFTNVSWIAAVADLGAGPEAEVVLDQYVVTTPRTTEGNHPITGETLFRYGRGMRVTALDGAAGDTMWTSVVLDPLAARPNVESEENFESLAWTSAYALDDMDGDGAPEIMASYVALEESLASSIAGAYRTHFVPISGANGTALWDVRQQGWGVARPLAPTILGVGMLDVPTDVAAGQRFPPKFVRMLALDAATGESRWSYERAFAQNSYLSYNLGLSQFVETLAPLDADRDGVLDLVTPSQYAPPTGRDQVLLAAASHTYEVRSGRDGAVLATLRAGGPDGRALPCGAESGGITILSGHARRLDVSRFDSATGERLWRATLYNDPVPRAATTGIDTVALAASCADTSEGTLVGLDLQAYSYNRRHEVIPTLALVSDAGAARWQEPALRGNPPGDALMLASIDDPPPSVGARVAAGIGALALGVGAAVATIVALVRAGSRLVVAGLVLAVVASPLAGALALEPPLAPAPVAPEAAPAGPEALAAQMREIAADYTPERHVALVGASLTGGRFPAMAGNETPTGFAENDTITYTFDVGDVDRDGVGDVALDQYCVSFDACGSYVSLPDGAADYLLSSPCGPFHAVSVVSGRDGRVIWSEDLDIVGPANTCGQRFLVGLVPVKGQLAFLDYRYQVVWSGINLEGVVLHEISARSVADGSVLWTFSEQGHYATDFVSFYEATNFVINPVLQVGSERWDRLLPERTQAALFLQGVGWASSGATTVFPIAPTYSITDDQLVVEDVFAPREWAARIDLDTGAASWRRDTFQPTPGRNVLPMVVEGRYGFDLFAPAGIQRGVYWDEVPCCFDTTGDGVPDLVYRTVEWNPLPNAKVQGPLFLDARLVMLDGATGETVVEEYVARDVQATASGDFRDRYGFVLGLFLTWFNFDVDYELVGDADGDGAADLLMHQRFLAPEYRDNLTLLSGRTGAPLWTRESIRDMRALVLGDADGDGGTDFLLLDYYGHEAGRVMREELDKPAAIPVTLHSGRTGERLWRATTYLAPADVLEIYKMVDRNGAPDVDGDGVGDFFVDEPAYLEDQTAVHDVRVVSGRDGAPLRALTAVGAFALPARAGDLDDDGRDEIALLSGDLSDLWLTTYDGASGEADWSRRVVALPTSSYTQALPYLRILALDAPERDQLSVTFHLDISALSSYTCVFCSDGSDISAAEERFDEYAYTIAQAYSLRGDDGRVAWALPLVSEVDAIARVDGATPGAQVFAKVIDRTSGAGMLRAAGTEAAPYALPAGGGFVVGYAAALAVGVALVRLKRRFEGVPDLG